MLEFRSLDQTIDWLRTSDEPWTRYRALIDLQGEDLDSAAARKARRLVARHPLVSELVARAAEWSQYPLKRHNDARHPLHTLSVLADFGMTLNDPGMEAAVRAVLTHQSGAGPFQTYIQLYKQFGGVEGKYWSWMLCDAPTILYSLAALGLADEPAVQRAAAHLRSVVREPGYLCTVAPELGAFHGPGRRTDPCPYANLVALKALAQFDFDGAEPALRRPAEMLLHQWEHRHENRYYLFGMGSDFLKLKYPFVWFDILHVVDVLSRLPFVRGDPRFEEMVAAIASQADANGRYTSGSIYMAWKGWSFADKKTPSPWLTLCVERVRRRLVDAVG
jgi:hypothetical protein